MEKNNKIAPLYARLGFKQKTFSNCQATYQKELCCLKVRQFFSHERMYRYAWSSPPPPVYFSYLFKDVPCTMTITLEWPLMPYSTIDFNGLKSQTSTKRIEIIKTTCHRVNKGLVISHELSILPIRVNKMKRIT